MARANIHFLASAGLFDADTSDVTVVDNPEPGIGEAHTRTSPADSPAPSERTNTHRTFPVRPPWIATLTTAVVLGVIGYAAATDTPVGLIVRDPNQVSQGRAWTGLVSTLGNGLWAVSIGILLLTLVVLRSRQPQPTDPANTVAFGSLFLLTVALFLDDSLLLHDVVFPSFGVPELLFVGAYGVAGIGAFLLAYRVIVNAGALGPFTAALGAFALSVLVDIFDLRNWGPDLMFAVEDGVKFVGIGFWADAIMRMGRHVVISRR